MSTSFPTPKSSRSVRGKNSLSSVDPLYISSIPGTVVGDSVVNSSEGPIVTPVNIKHVPEAFNIEKSPRNLFTPQVNKSMLRSPSPTRNSPPSSPLFAGPRSIPEGTLNETYSPPSSPLMSRSSVPKRLTGKSGIDVSAISSSSPRSILQGELGESNSRVEIFRDNFDNKLIERGFVVLNVVHFEEKNMTFIKAYNIAGDIVFIEVDIPGEFTSKRLTNSPTIKAVGSVIPRSMKVDVQKCASSFACGVAFQCNNEICIVNQKDTGEVFDEVFEIDNTDNNPAYKSAVAFPIVTLSQIMNDLSGSTFRIRQSTKALQSKAFNHNLMQIDELSKKSEILTNWIKSLRDRCVAFNEIQINEHEMWLVKFDAMNRAKDAGTLTPQLEAEAKQIVDRLYNLNVITNQLVSFMGKYSQYNSEIDKMIFNSSTSYYNLYKISKSTFTPEIPQSAAFLKANNWGLPEDFDQISDISQGFKQLSPEKEAMDKVKTLRYSLQSGMM